MKIRVVVICFLLLCGSLLQAQSGQKPCSAEQFSQFDFWIGDWMLTWSDTLHGTNSITKEFNDCVIYEHFDGNPGAKFKGMSVSTFNMNTKMWHQTWVDDQGGYLDFKGGMVADSMILTRSFEKQGSTIFQRMVWFDITGESFSWNWERSVDNKNWKVAWAIEYKRK